MSQPFGPCIPSPTSREAQLDQGLLGLYLGAITDDGSEMSVRWFCTKSVYIELLLI